MYWYTNSDGQLCVGSEQQNKFINLEVQTQHFPTCSIHESLTLHQVLKLGVFPEDWPHTPDIARKISRLARRLFADRIGRSHSRPARLSVNSDVA